MLQFFLGRIKPKAQRISKIISHCELQYTLILGGGEFLAQRQCGWPTGKSNFIVED